MVPIRFVHRLPWQFFVHGILLYHARLATAQGFYGPSMGAANQRCALPNDGPRCKDYAHHSTCQGYFFGFLEMDSLSSIHRSLAHSNAYPFWLRRPPSLQRYNDGIPLGRERSDVALAKHPRRQRFVEEYVVDGNATQAAIRAGYSPKTAKAQGSRLLTFVDVATAVAELQQQVSVRVQLDAQYVLLGLARNAEEARALGTPQFAASNRALELIGKHAGMFNETARVDHRHAHVVVTAQGVRDDNV